MHTIRNVYDVKSGELRSNCQTQNSCTKKISSHKNTLVFMRESETTKKDSFLHFSKAYDPGCILDIRIAPRLDVFFGSRNLSFSSFKEFDIKYFDFLGGVGIDSREQIPKIEQPFIEACIYLLSSDTYNSRPIVLFFDDNNTLSRCSTYLSNSLFSDSLPDKSLNIAEFKSGLLKIRTLESKKNHRSPSGDT